MKGKQKFVNLIRSKTLLFKMLLSPINPNTNNANCECSALKCSCLFVQTFILNKKFSHKAPKGKLPPHRIPSWTYPREV